VAVSAINLGFSLSFLFWAHEQRNKVYQRQMMVINLVSFLNRFSPESITIAAFVVADIFAILLFVDVNLLFVDRADWGFPE
jgi:hypothetical protein